MEGIQRIPEGTNARGEEQFTLRMESATTSAPDKVEAKAHKQQKPSFPLPDFFLKTAPQEPFPPQPLVPSRPSDTEPATASPLAAKMDPNRFKRGNITHKLLQILPSLPEDNRRFAAEKFLKRSALGLSPDLQQSIATETLAILNDPAFGPIFGPDSLAEIPVTGLLEDNTLISGQIDRLLVTDREILIVDFKTNRPPPQKAEDVPAIYHRQLKAYADALRRIYKGRTVRAALLWTDGARLMEIPV
jgi:ATP-dependent helicase/nuclease subunit A